MQKDFQIDLKSARRKSGLSQSDCGHLLGGSKTRISALETGKRIPTVREICSLSFIYGRSFDAFFSEVFAGVRKEMSERLSSLPDRARDDIQGMNRKATIDRIAERLSEEHDPSYGG